MCWSNQHIVWYEVELYKVTGFTSLAKTIQLYWRKMYMYVFTPVDFIPIFHHSQLSYTHPQWITQDKVMWKMSVVILCTTRLTADIAHMFCQIMVDDVCLAQVVGDQLLTECTSQSRHIGFRLKVDVESHFKEPRSYRCIWDCNTSVVPTLAVQSVVMWLFNWQWDPLLHFWVG